ncbi:MAG: excinuclease ABC subunit UvrA, partial [Muribaculaceae bacterium]|nr:excinuclease ABC subunit UvrA [Muribaculaceae bacterium]
MFSDGYEFEEGCIDVYGARVHNLKNIDVRLPHGKLSVVTGLSGCGKSSLAFDTIFAEGQRRYIETFSAYARNMLGSLDRPDVDKITGLSPVISIEQKTVNKNPRSTI